MKIFTRLALVVLLLLIQVSAFAATIIITVKNFEYSPKTVSINPGDEVKWQWESGVHPTASDNTAWTTFPMDAANTTMSIIFKNPGSFPYHCTIHGAPGVGGAIGSGMAGMITVGTATPIFSAKLLPPALSVYPNPAKGMVLVSINQKMGQQYKLRLTNIIGREIRTVTVFPEATSEGALPMNLSDLPSGMYFYSLLVNDKVLSTKRLVLQN